MLTSNFNINWAQGYTPEVPDTWETKAGGLLEPTGLRPAWQHSETLSQNRRNKLGAGDAV
jgi:hypothetical protein